MSDLLPCPFCGSWPKLSAYLGVWCDNDECAIVGQVFSAGARHWNRRAQPAQSATSECVGAIINHDEARQLAAHKSATSNLARCYLDLHKRLKEDEAECRNKEAQSAIDAASNLSFQRSKEG